MSEKAPMPPWWVEEVLTDDGRIFGYEICGGRRSDSQSICFIYADEGGWSNAKELADLIVQRTKQ